MSAAALLARLDGVRQAGDGRWRAFCPAHQPGPHRAGRTCSLSVAEGREGALIHCHAGCSAAEVVAAAGLHLADLFPSRPATRFACGNGGPARWAGVEAAADSLCDAALDLVLTGGIGDLFHLLSRRDRLRDAVREARRQGGRG